MTVREFKEWTRITNLSRLSWTMDEVSRLNKNEMLYYRGGKNGKFIQITSTGLLSLGSYEGAVPHIGEALFHVTFRKQFSSQDIAYQRVVEVAGVNFMLESICGVGK